MKSPKPVTPVLVNRERILTSTVGLRPHRNGGFRLEMAPLQGKTLIHNYGHGGDGVSLSQGCAQIAAEMAHASGARHTAIIGGGVMGLTTARFLAAWGHDVTLYAAELPPYTTSNMSGAQIIVPDDFDRHNPTAQVAQQDYRVRTLSLKGWDAMAGEHGYGVKRVENYFLSGPNSGEGREPDNVFLGRRIRRKTNGIIVDPGLYLDALLKDIRSAGVAIKQRKFNAVTELLYLPQQTIVNCTGLGASELFLDKDVVPVRGQLTLLKPQPDIDYAYIAQQAPRNVYMFPRETSIVLGGTYERGKTHLTIDQDTVAHMLRVHGEMAKHAYRHEPAIA